MYFEVLFDFLPAHFSLTFLPGTYNNEERTRDMYEEQKCIYARNELS